MPPREDRQPLRRGEEREQQRRGRGGQERQRSQLIARRQHNREPFARRERRRRAAGRVERMAKVCRQPEEAEREHAQADGRARRQGFDEDRPIAHLAEPQPIHEKRRRGWKDEEEESKDD